MNWFLLYLLLLKAVATSFSGMASLAIVRQDFVVRRHLITDRQLNTAIVAGRSGPGPNGLYLVSVGYFVAGVPGALAGLLALITPAFLVIPMMNWMARYAYVPRIRSAIRAVVLGSAGLLASATVALARDAATGVLTVVLMAITFLLLTFTDVESWWVILGAAAAGLAAHALV
jgi:chromate transporter